MIQIKKIKKRLASYYVKQLALLRWRIRGFTTGRGNSMPMPVVVTLTSYPPRFATLTLTLKCLLTQSVKADHIVLWIAHSDIDALPQDVLSLKNEGLEVRACEDSRSYKKIIPALISYPDAVIVTADDDIYYYRKWLEDLLNQFEIGSKRILCHRAHLITLDETSTPRPYSEWRHDVRHQLESSLLFPTGNGGVLYPPGALSPEATDEESFMTLCPTADDIWLNFMARGNGSSWRKVSGHKPFRSWPNSQRVSLMESNVEGGENDAQFTAMYRKYGLKKTS